MPITVQSTPVKVNIYVSGGNVTAAMVNPMTTAGDMIYGGVSGTPLRLSIGSNTQVLTLVGGLPTWASASAGGVTSVTGTVNQITSAPTTGAVILTLPSLVAFPGTWTEGTLSYSDTGILWSSQSSIAGYNQVILQNTSNASNASTNHLVSNDVGTASTFFGEFGMNSSGFTGSGSWNIASAVYLDSMSSDLAIGTLSNNSLHFFTNSSTTDRLTIDGTGLSTFGGRVIVTSTATLPGLNIGTSGASDPSTTVNFDIWGVTGSLRTKIGGSAATIPYIGTIANNRILMFNGTAGRVDSSPFQATSATGVGQVVQTNGQAIFQLIDINLTSIAANGEFVTAAFGGLTGDPLSSASTSTAQWAAGTVATQRFNYFKGRTLTGVSATATFTDAYTFYVDPPTAGTNATITRAWAAGFSGSVKVTGSVANSGFYIEANGAGITQGIRTASSSAMEIGGFIGGSSHGNVNFVDNGFFYAKFSSASNIQSFLFGQNAASVNGFIYGVASVLTSAWVPAFRIDAGAHTSITAALESIDIDFNLARNVQWLAGTVTTQRQFYIRGVTLIGASATATFTNAATLAISGAPNAGTNASITTGSALLIQAGSVGSTIISYGATINAQTGGTGGNYSAQFLGGLGVQFSQSSSSSTHGFISFSQSAHTGGTPIGINYTGGSHTTLLLSTEATDILFNLARTVQFSTGALAIQRAYRISAPTYGFVGASTLTNAYTFYVDSAPVTGTNATITNSYAAGFGGNVSLLTAGNKFFIKEGTNGSMGQVALVAGTKAISITGVTTSTRAFVQLVTPSSASLTIQYQAVCTAGTLTIQANVAAGTINASDVSTLNYIIFEPTP